MKIFEVLNLITTLQKENSTVKEIFIEKINVLITVNYQKIFVLSFKTNNSNSVNPKININNNRINKPFNVLFEHFLWKVNIIYFCLFRFFLTKKKKIYE
jgi:hypothetical protein